MPMATSKRCWRVRTRSSSRSAAQSLIENEAKARLSKELVKLDDDVPLPCPLSALRVKPYDPEKLFPFLDEMELRALKSRIERRLSIARADRDRRAERAGHPRDPALPGRAHLCRRRYGGGSRPLDRGGGAGGRGRDLGGAERARRHSAGILRDRAGGRRRGWRPMSRSGTARSRRPRKRGCWTPRPHAGTGGGGARCRARTRSPG